MTRSRLASWVASGVLALTVVAVPPTTVVAAAEYCDGRVELPRQGFGCSDDDVDGWRRRLVGCLVVLPSATGG